jgi:DNA-binding HxlR family transcriptional regulator
VRSAYSEIPPRVEHGLTALGLTLREPPAAIRDWAETHIHEIIAARERLRPTTTGRRRDR